MLLTSAVIVAAFYWIISKRIDQTLSGLRRIEAGNLSVRLGAESGDGLGVLQAGINAMVAQLEAQVAELADRERRSRQLSERLRALGQRLAEVQESERRQLARELHDQAGRNLTALGLSLNLIRAQIADNPAVLASTLPHLDAARTLIKETSHQLRDVMAHLRPPVLDDYGLAPALHWYTARFAAWTSLAATVEGTELAPRLPPDVENALFRITQEALNNVAKHAQAGQVVVSITRHDDRVQLVIVDDGVGFDRNGIDSQTLVAVGVKKPRWGLVTMAERAEAVGGHCRVESKPGQGTRVVVEIPD